MATPTKLCLSLFPILRVTARVKLERIVGDCRPRTFSERTDGTGPGGHRAGAETPPPDCLVRTESMTLTDPLNDEAPEVTHESKLTPMCLRGGSGDVRLDSIAHSRSASY